MSLHHKDNMETMNKLKLFYNLADAQGIRVVVNTGTTTYVPIPLEKVSPALTPIHTWVVETPIPSPKVDRIVSDATTLTVEESILPPLSIKRARG